MRSHNIRGSRILALILFHYLSPRNSGFVLPCQASPDNASPFPSPSFYIHSYFSYAYVQERISATFSSLFHLFLFAKPVRTRIGILVLRRACKCCRNCRPNKESLPLTLYWLPLFYTAPLMLQLTTYCRFFPREDLKNAFELYFWTVKIFVFATI